MFKWIRNKHRIKDSLNKNEVEEMIKSNDNTVLLDVRSPQEFAENHLNNSINIPTYEIYQKAQEIIKDKDAIIICYCTLGIRSRKAVKMLKKMGYKNLYNLDEGIK